MAKLLDHYHRASNRLATLTLGTQPGNEPPSGGCWPSVQTFNSNPSLKPCSVGTSMRDTSNRNDLPTGHRAMLASALPSTPVSEPAATRHGPFERPRQRWDLVLFVVGMIFIAFVGGMVIAHYELSPYKYIRQADEVVWDLKG